jgi:phospholipid/cholesterol/gamma-HCH transport system permease protein
LSEPSRLGVERSGATLLLRLAGPWTLAEGVPATDPVAAAVESGGVERIAFEASELGEWDSALVTFIYGVAELAPRHGVSLDVGDLPEAPRRLLALATAVPRRDLSHGAPDDATTARVGRAALEAWGTLNDALRFLGETVQAASAMLRGRARFRRVDLLHAFESAGVAALGIVALINFLIGAVLAFVGAVQLGQFGAELYVADLVAIGVTRELGALMTGIVMAGRTGASFAAVLGTMTVNEEVDALETLGLRPVEFLVLPRVLATTLMMPALVVYADLLGMLGGLFVGVAVLDLGTLEYFSQSQGALALRHVLIGLGKSVAFGGVVALTGCYYGIRCGRSAAAVGTATTSAVVISIVLLVVVDAVLTVGLHVVGL